VWVKCSHDLPLDFTRWMVASSAMGRTFDPRAVSAADFRRGSSQCPGLDQLREWLCLLLIAAVTRLSLHCVVAQMKKHRGDFVPMLPIYRFRCAVAVDQRRVSS
jgi:hypothetical protein